MDDDLDDYKLETTWHINPSHVVHVSFDRDHRRAGPGVKKLDSWYRRKELGVGFCGVVHLETTGESGRERAVKSIRKSMARRLNIDYRRELAAITTFSRAKLGDLSKHVSEGIKEHDLKDISLQMLEGPKLMHSRGFAHRDLKTQNIFVYQKQPSWWIKIGDFGISKRVKDCDTTELRTTTGTPGYEAPEIRGYVEVDEANPSSVYTKVVDIWSLGCVIYKVMTNRVPFQSGREIRRFCDGKDPFPTESLLGKVSNDGIIFLQSVLVTRLNVRPTADVALQHPWLKRNEEHVDYVPQIIASSMKENAAQKGAYDREHTSNSALDSFEDVKYHMGIKTHALTGQQMFVKPLSTPGQSPQHSAVSVNSIGENKTSIEGQKNLMTERISMPGSYPYELEDSNAKNETSLDHNSQAFLSEKGTDGVTPQSFSPAQQTQPFRSQGNATSNEPIKAPIKTTASPSRHEQEVSASDSAVQVKIKESGHPEGFLENVRYSLSNDQKDRHTAQTGSQEALSKRLRDALPKAEPLRNRGDAAMLDKNYRAAISLYTSALRYLPGNAILLSNRAAAYCALNYPSCAEADATAAIVSRPWYSIGWSGLGYARNQMRDIVGSWQAYQQAIASGGRSDAIRHGYEATGAEIARKDLREVGSTVLNPRPSIIEERLDYRPLRMEEPIEAKSKSNFSKSISSEGIDINMNKGHSTGENLKKSEEEVLLLWFKINADMTTSPNTRVCQLL